MIELNCRGTKRVLFTKEKNENKCKKFKLEEQMPAYLIIDYYFYEKLCTILNFTDLSTDNKKLKKICSSYGCSLPRDNTISLYLIYNSEYLLMQIWVCT